MSHYRYHDGILHAEGVPLPRIAGAVGTPLYCYSSRMIEEAYEAYSTALAEFDPLICYAMKANGTIAVLKVLVELGAGIDVVSGGELARALAAGAPPERIVFSGVGKTDPEIAAAVAAGIHQLNAESLPELERISTIARAAGRTTRVAIRVNPDVAADTHHKISTGNKETKFGIDFEHAEAAWRLAESLEAIEPVGLAVHIGSQLTSLAPYERAYMRLAGLVGRLREAGHAVARLDLGGGRGIAYGGSGPPPLTEYADVVRRTVGDLGCRLAFEPGRSLVGAAGVLLTRVIFVKEGLHRRFAIVDAAMNDLIRPTLYDAFHSIVPVVEPAGDADLEPHDVVGPICETGDILASQRPLPPMAPGDLLAIEQAGAYAAVMASTYNARPIAPEVMVRDGRFGVVRPRQGIEELMAAELGTDWVRRSVEEGRGQRDASAPRVDRGQSSSAPP